MFKDDDVKIDEPEQPSNSTKAINKFVVLALIVIAMGIGVILNWSLQSDNVITLNKQPIPTRTIREHPTAGGVVILTIDMCKNVAVEGVARMSFVSESREIFLPNGPERTPQGCRVVEFAVLIPKDIPADTYRIKIRTVHDVNPLKRGIVNEFFSTPVVIDKETANVN